ncbi:MAG: hypothetical protein H6831_09735 [Planctomycetes bacterium]|nr:hypothetical protein [Planctomycetota bacterium]MCB9904674.1 hypothetical protein [Planctomycetota bacterium]
MEDSVRTVRLRDPREPAEPQPTGPPRWLVPVLPFVFLGATLAGVWIVKRGPIGLFGALIAVAIVLGFGWFLASTFLPAAPADRTCPACGAEDGLGPAFEDTTRGVACRACDYLDETASAWMIAEEDGPLESVVLRERAARRTPRENLGPPGNEAR